MDKFRKGEIFDRVQRRKDSVLIGANVAKFDVFRNLVPNVIAAAEFQQSRYGEPRTVPNHHLSQVPNPILVILLGDMRKEAEQENKARRKNFISKIQDLVTNCMTLSTGESILAQGYYDVKTQKKCDLLVTHPVEYKVLVNGGYVQTSNTQFLLVYYAEHDLTHSISDAMKNFQWPLNKSVTFCCSALGATSGFFIQKLMQRNHAKFFLPFTPQMNTSKEEKCAALREIIYSRPAGERIIVLCNDVRTNDSFGQSLTTVDGVKALSPNRGSRDSSQFYMAFEQFTSGKRNVLILRLEEIVEINIQIVDVFFNFDTGLQTYISAGNESIDGVVVLGKKLLASDPNYLQKLGY